MPPKARCAAPCNCFNPRPPLLAGDARGLARAHTGAGCFNPRPPLLAGDAEVSVVDMTPEQVSIRARHCWRAMPFTKGVEGRHRVVSIRARHCWRAMLTSARKIQPPTCAFQSAPAIAGGRCTAVAQEIKRREVSIRARHCWRAMRTGPVSGLPGLRFQSAPAIAGGRCCGRHCQDMQHVRFNPRPPLLAGDASLIRRRMVCRSSFNPRPPLLAGDANRSRARDQAARGFNPRPPLLAGDALVVAVGHVVLHVSIRARHCWRAMRCCSPPDRGTKPFQSAPAIAGGRCARAGRKSRAWRGFNPRPPLLAGDASHQVASHSPRVVSIRARHCWRAMHLTAKAVSAQCFSLLVRELSFVRSKARAEWHKSEEKSCGGNGL